MSITSEEEVELARTLATTVGPGALRACRGSLDCHARNFLLRREEMRNPEYRNSEYITLFDSPFCRGRGREHRIYLLSIVALRLLTSVVRNSLGAGIWPALMNNAFRRRAP